MPSTDPIIAQVEWTLIQAGPFVGRMTNITNTVMFARVATSLPDSDAGAVTVGPNLSVALETGENLYVRAFASPAPVQMDSEFVMVASPPLVLMTDKGGKNARLRVDPGQTGFFAGRMFRAFFEGVIPVAGPSVQFRFTSPIDFILWAQQLELTQGALQLDVYIGATPSGTWTPITPIGVNRMSERPQPFYAPAVTIETGGNFSGGTRVDMMRIRTSSANNSANNVGGAFTERGLPAGTYYGRLATLTGGLTVNDAAQYIYQLVWEERQQF